MSVSYDCFQIMTFMILSILSASIFVIFVLSFSAIGVAINDFNYYSDHVRKQLSCFIANFHVKMYSFILMP